MQARDIKYSRLYSAFKSIDGHNEYREIISFVRHNEKDISLLEFSEYFDLMISYSSALFEVGNYQKFLFYVDSLIELSVFNNIKIYKGENIFQKLLFRKAAANFQLEKYDKAIYVIKELIKLDPKDKLTQRFLLKCYLKNISPKQKLNRSFAILIFLIVGLITGIELLVIRHFYVDYITFFEWTRNILFLSGLVILFLGDGWHLFKIKMKIRKFIDSLDK